MLPHISAPGEVVVSLLSSHLTPEAGYDIESVQEGGHYLGLEGTSIAAAFTTGTIAEMLAQLPTLTPETARRILQETATVDLQTSLVPNNAFGAGKLNIEAAIERATQIASGCCGCQPRCRQE